MKPLYLKKWFLFLLLLLIAAPIFFVLNSNSQALAIKNFLDHYEIVFLIWRTALLMALFCIWPMWMKYYAKKYVWDTQQEKRMIDRRYTLVFWLIIIDLVMVENIPARFF
jgi:hypothetical protein